jgi:hypothetical protein
MIKITVEMNHSLLKKCFICLLNFRLVQKFIILSVFCIDRIFNDLYD